MNTPQPAIPMLSGIRDNYGRGSVGDFLRDKLQPGSVVSIVSAYFTIYAYAALQDELDSIEGLRFLFGEPRFVRAVDPDKTQTKGLPYRGQRTQARQPPRAEPSGAPAPIGSGPSWCMRCMG